MKHKRLIFIAICLFLGLSAMAPLSANALEQEGKTVRVGWYESAFHRTDQFGRLSGYGYEYQQRIAVYTGWKYEYVEGSWSELLEKLIAGEIDLLSDVSYTEERAEKILYSAEAMGSEGYHVFISPTNAEIRPDDFSSLNGKRVLVNKNSIQEQLFIDWANTHDVHPAIVETTEKTPVMLEMLAAGQFDALVTLDTYGNSADVIPVWKVGFAESFFGINKNRPDLKRDLDVAMNRLFEDNRDFNQQMTEKFNKGSSVNSFLSTEEVKWLNSHGTIRIGYRDNFLPYSDSSESEGVLSGALSDYLAFAETCEKNARLQFEARAFPTTEDALKALENNEIDCVFPVSISSYDAEQRGIILTDPLVTTEAYVAVRSADHLGISADREMTVAVMKGHPSHESFIMNFFPNWKIVHYEGGAEAFKAVATGDADCTIVSNYRINRVSDLCNKYNLATLATGNTMDLSFAVSKGNDCLYSILNKTSRLLPDSTVNSSLSNYGFRDEKVTFIEFLSDNLPYVIATVSLITVIILLLILRNVRSEAKVAERQQIISETERDQLTNLYNGNFFLAYANRIFREASDKQMDAIVIDIDRFHSINALHGREFGDKVLLELGEEIKDLLRSTEGIASRVEADRFDIFCLHREDWQTQLEQFQARLDSLMHYGNIHLRMGVKYWQPGIEPVVQFDQARIACNKLRGDFKTQVIVYDEEMAQREEFDQRLINDLGRAIEQHELEVHYQPKYNIQSEKPTLSSAEALVRWCHPELGMLSPGDFIPLFERSGQIRELDKYVWEEAVRQIAEWRKNLGVTIPISVNLSRVDVFDPDLCNILDRLVAKHGLTPHDLNLEVTESAYTENADQLIRVIKQLRKNGYEIEMDDFGSGYSSLNMLSSMPIDILKMDIAFIRNIERNEKDFRLVELIIDIGRYLRVPVVAEGVETEIQLNLLKNAGCDLVQGYYFSRPLSAVQFEQTILRDHLKA